VGVAMATAVDEDILVYVVAALLDEVVFTIFVALCKLLVVVLLALMAELSIGHQDGDKVASASFTSKSLTSPVSGLIYQVGEPFVQQLSRGG
jgi:hypothetical protein